MALIIVAEDLLMSDDTSSQSSLNSFEYSKLNYCSGNENDFDWSTKTGESNFNTNTNNCTRFCPEESRSRNFYNQSSALLDTHQRAAYGLNHRPKMTRIKSMVDIRSQLLHRSLVEEIKKRHLFKTVDAVENIGYKEPGEFSGDMSMYGGFSRRSSGNCERKRLE